MGNQTSTVIRALRGSTTYYVSVRAYNTAGSGPPSATVNVTTKKPRKYLLSSVSAAVGGALAPAPDPDPDPGPGLSQSQVTNVSLSVFAAPSQAPIKVMWNTSNSKIILNWEQVKALENESEVTGYKVSVRSLSFGISATKCRRC